MIKVLLLHNIVSPYRIPIFEELNNHFQLDVFFCKKSSRKRNWDSSLDGVGFTYRILSGLQFGPFILNYDLLPALLTRDYDIFIIPDNTSNLLASLITAVYGKLSNVPYVVWTGSFHSDFRKQKPGNTGRLLSMLVQFVRRKICIHADHVIAYSELTKSSLISQGIEPGKISVGGQVMPEGLLQESEVDGVSKKFENRTVILYLGYLNLRKGIHNLIEAFKELNLAHSALVIAGSGPYRKELEELAGNDKNIHFVGYVEGEKKAAFYSVADVFVLPTLHDPWGLVVNEAMYYGLPVVVTSAAGASQMIKDAANGFIVAPGDVQGLKSAIGTLARNEKLRRKFGQRSIGFSEAHSLEAGTSVFLQVIDNVMGRV